MSRNQWRGCSPIRVLCLEAERPMYEVAEACGVDVSAFRAIVNGRRSPQPSTLAKIAQELGVDPAMLWSKHVGWLAFEPTLDAYTLRRGAVEAKRASHPFYTAILRNGLNITEASRASGVSTRTLRRIFRGHKNPSLRTAWLLAQATGESLDDLVSDLIYWIERLDGVPDEQAVGVCAVLHEELEERRQERREDGDITT